MMESDQLIHTMDARVRRREDRRAFFKTAIGAAAIGATLSIPLDAAAQTAPSDADILNFALNLEYLEAQFYAYAANGTGLASNLLTGSGTQGSVNGGRQVTFTDPVVRQYAREIAADEVAHVAFLRNALGTSAVAQPAIDIGVGPNTAFSNAARAAGLIGAGATFDPYANDENFLLGAFIFEDVGVTAYKGASPLITNNTYLDAAAGILAVEAFHAGLIRNALYAKGIGASTLRTASESISNARDTLDGPADLDQGVATQTVPYVNTGGTTVNVQVSNIAPTDANGIAFSRTPAQVLNIVYLTAGTSASSGGFFPNGVNGTLRTTAA
ncbi:ferritin-like domain-containing protein [Sphingomonadaceae bacterium OTU29MARTA1]|uniref:ferritin-like domain-containing protein n=1 Tax=Sphingomonas sp. Leaf37 TaxID=2876552 RepID=UPI001E2D571A|nr:ferritin-like domain-containing protein [Sphingomonas sp. Leaf37]USU09524.1 ferritin-like domain-containing protein [Sphingomonadaceae bacterium OTU29MARTA1]USU12958.1 ferritin-like domain-containing protein [Sphingomonadaceae bacterium OTU29THOMA1]